jgi:hypothetical protein
MSFDHNPADDLWDAREYCREQLADKRGCSADDISDADLDEHLAEEHEADLAAREAQADAERERRLEREIDAIMYQRDMHAELEPENQPYEGD